MPRARSSRLSAAAEPYEQGLLDVGDGHQLHWELYGRRDGKPAVALHGGPGTHDVGRFFPAERRRFRDGVPAAERGDLVIGYNRRLLDPDPEVHEPAARAWCRWEDAHVRTRRDDPPDARYDDARFRLCFARLVTHHWRHAAWLDDDALLRDAGRLTGIPGVLVHGRLDLSAPLDVPWRLARSWKESELIVVEDEGHRGGSAMTDRLVSATRRFAGRL